MVTLWRFIQEHAGTSVHLADSNIFDDIPGAISQLRSIYQESIPGQLGIL